jgi:hypothetical protein
MAKLCYKMLTLDNVMTIIAMIIDHPKTCNNEDQGTTNHHHRPTKPHHDHRARARAAEQNSRGSQRQPEPAQRVKERGGERAEESSPRQTKNAANTPE